MRAERKAGLRTLAIWKYRGIDQECAQELAQALHLSPAVSRLLAARGFDDAEKARAFLDASLDDITRPYLIPGMGAAVETLDLAIRENKHIVIYGDYDVDGICASVLMKEALDWLGCRARIYIPSRMKEGYGMNAEALTRLQAEGADLILTVDNGISAKALIDGFSSQGLRFVVTDHHQLPQELPDCIIVNPLMTKSDFPCHNLCGCGTAYFLAMALLIRLMPEAYDRMHREALLDLAALATVADQMPLIGDNRILVREGLNVINSGRRPGLAALTKLVVRDEVVDTGSVGFRIAPCINASGRLDATSVAVDLLSAQGGDLSTQAEKLAACNEERKEIERCILSEALEQIQDHTGPLYAAVVTGEEWHPGVIGIVASRLTDKYHCPSVVLTRRETDGDLFVGSARSVEGFHIYQHLQKLSYLLESFGGHEMAAGLSLWEENLSAFREAFTREAAECETIEKEKSILIDGALRLEEVDEALYKDLCLMAPFGNANEEPLFALEHQRRFSYRAVGTEGAHLKLIFETKEKESVPGIAFRQGSYPFLEGRRYDFAVHINENCFMGTCNVQLQVAEIQPSSIGTDEKAERIFLEHGVELSASDALDGLGDKNEILTRIRGVSFEERQKICKSLKEGQRIFLEREAFNPADTNAISCVTESGEKLGYLSRAIACQLAPLMDLGACYKANVIQVTGEDEALRGVNICVKRQQAEQALSSVEQRGALARLENEELTEVLCETLIGDGELFDLQLRAVDTVTNAHRNAVVLAPTGRGKSLIYQLSAGIFALRDKKMTVVISPLRALINDQYHFLTERFASLGLRVCKGTGELSQNDRIVLEEALSHGKVDLLFCTPEFFACHQELFQLIREHLGLIVIDEAHHLTGRRPAYQKILKLKDDYDQVEWIYLTATVPPTEAAAFLRAVGNASFFCDDYVRDNLVIRDERHAERKLVYLYRLLMHNDKTVCYVNSRRQAFDICRRLRELLPYQLRSSVYYYHGGLPQEIRRRIEENFRDGEIQLLISTTAFGEGVNIPDIRNVVLYHPCFSVEAFNQLSGRASRDGESGIIHLLYTERDLSLNEMIISKRAPGREDMGKMYMCIKNHAGSTHFVIEDDTDRIYDRFVEMDPRFDRKQWRLALNVFAELGFLHMASDGKMTRIEVQEHPQHRSLTESLNYLEGAGERRALEEYERIAFSGDIAALESIIRQALYPKEWMNRGVTS